MGNKSRASSEGRNLIKTGRLDGARERAISFIDVNSMGAALEIDSELARHRAYGHRCLAWGRIPGGVAQAITDNAFKYTTPKTGYLNIPAMGFAPLQLTPEFYFQSHFLRQISSEAQVACYAARCICRMVRS